jgi:transposase
MQFGRSSEKLDRQIEQLELRLEELQTSQAEKTAANIAVQQSLANQPVKAPVWRSLPDGASRWECW